MKWIGYNQDAFKRRNVSGEVEISKVSDQPGTPCQPTLELSAWSTTATAAHAGRIKFLKSGTAALDTYTAGNHTTAGEILGRIEAYGVDDADGETLAAYIQFANDAVSDADSTPGKIIFATSDADDAGEPTIRLTIDDDGISTFTGRLIADSGITIDSVGITTVQTSAESFSDNDTSVMTSAAIEDKILSYGYSTTAGDITGVTAGTNLTGGGSSGAVTINLADASTSAKGAASFSSDNFAVSSGAVTIKSGGVDLTDEVTGVLPVANTAAKVTSIVAGDGIDVSGATGDVTVTAEDASTTNPGVVELATTAETTTGTDTARAVTPDGLKDGYQGSTNVATLGTITTGVWRGDAIATTYTAAKVTSIVAGDGIDVSGATGDVTVTAETATDSNPGIVELATTGEADTGTDTARAITAAGLKSHVDARFSYQYISFTGNATVPSDGDWMTLTANGISNHTWTTNLGGGDTTVGSSTVTIPTSILQQGIIVPYDCTLVGYASLIRSVGNHQSKVGLAVGVPTYNDFATFDCTLRAYNAADISAGPDTNYSQRPVRADYLNADHSMSAGHVIYPLIGSVASNSRVVQWNCTLVLKTLIP